MIRTSKTNNQDLAKWLRSYLLEGRPIPEVEAVTVYWERTGVMPSPEVMKSLYAYTIALDSIKTLELARATYFKSPVLSKLFPTHLALWVCIECSQERFLLRMHGITGNPVIFGKTDRRENNVAAIQRYKNCEVKGVNKETPAWIKQTHWSEKLDSLLFSEAQNIAQKDENFNKLYYIPYWTIRTKIGNVLHILMRQLHW
jgi:hypothetical protein